MLEQVVYPPVKSEAMGSFNIPSCLPPYRPTDTAYHQVNKKVTKNALIDKPSYANSSQLAHFWANSLTQEQSLYF